MGFGPFCFAVDFEILVLIKCFPLFWFPWAWTLCTCVGYFVAFYLLLSLCSFKASELTETVGSCRVPLQPRLLAARLNRCSCDSSGQPESSEMKPRVQPSAAPWLNQLQIMREGQRASEWSAKNKTKKDWRNGLCDLYTVAGLCNWLSYTVVFSFRLPMDL